MTEGMTVEEALTLLKNYILRLTQAGHLKPSQKCVMGKFGPVRFKIGIEEPDRPLEEDITLD